MSPFWVLLSPQGFVDLTLFLRQFAEDCWDLGCSGSPVWGVPGAILVSVGLLGTLRVPHLGSHIYYQELE